MSDNYPNLPSRQPVRFLWRNNLVYCLSLRGCSPTVMSSSISDALFPGRLHSNSRRNDVDNSPLFSTSPIYKLFQLALLPIFYKCELVQPTNGRSFITDPFQRRHCHLLASLLTDLLRFPLPSESCTRYQSVSIHAVLWGEL